MSMTSGRSLGRFVLVGVCVREPASCRSRARGRVERSVSSTSISFDEMDESEATDDLRRRFAGREEGSAHSGAELKRSYCLRNRLEYSLPLTISSAALTLSFRSRVSPANDTTILSSSLSSQAIASPSSSPVARTDIKPSESPVEGPVSRKKSFKASA